MMKSIALSNEFLKEFKIKHYQQAALSGQKTVFIVDIDDSNYALKIIHIADERFDREIEICQKFNHIEGIPSIISVKKFNGDTIILEEFIEGNDLSELLDLYIGQEEKVLKLIYEVAIILKPVWESRYVHRDLKPQNIRIRSTGAPVVLDFGIARALGVETITAAGSQPLSFYYASPEQYEGIKQLVSYRTDFFCLAILAYPPYQPILQ
ncbi:serine/threonine protein kinase, partial [Arcticibacter eurypsychrophilus]|uniref:serine/threonine protein kinase n=1 Tax=Arcticibacter eurypsychrophilus TaxID=1434752 RepID=UPI00147BC03D